jgi:hypothetical protein
VSVSATLERLAARLRRPLRALSGLSKLNEDELGRLEAAIDAACLRQRAQADQALRRLLPSPLRHLILRTPRDRVP